MVDITDRIIEASIALFVLASVGILALVNLFSVAQSSIPTTVFTLVTTLVGIMFSLAVALLFYRYTKHSKS